MTGILTHNTSNVSPIQRWCRAMEPSDNHATWHHQLLIIEKTFEMKCLLASLTCSPYIFLNPVSTNCFKKFDVPKYCVFSILHGRRSFRMRRKKNKICRINSTKKYLLQPVTVNNFKQNFEKKNRGYRIHENMSWARYTMLTLHVLKLERKKVFKINWELDFTDILPLFRAREPTSSAQ